MKRRAVLIGLAGLASACAAESMKAAPTAEENTFDPGATKSAGVRFTRPDGTPIYLNPHAVAFVRAPLSGEHGGAVIVFSNGAKQQVLETVDEVIHGITIEKEDAGKK